MKLFLISSTFHEFGFNLYKINRVIYSSYHAVLVTELLPITECTLSTFIPDCLMSYTFVHLPPIYPFLNSDVSLY